MSEATPAPAAVIRACEPRYCWALLRRSPLTQGMPWGSLIQPKPSRCWLFCWLPSRSSGIVRIVPSWKTKVMLRTWPRTQESVQSPEAVPLNTAPATSGMSMPFAVRLSGPTSTLKGYGSLTVPSIGTRPISAVIATDPMSVEFVGTV
jgi:hypothetical protein